MSSVPAVDPGEMAFALTLFAEAANRRVRPRNPPQESQPLADPGRCEQLFRDLILPVPPSAEIPELTPESQGQTSLYTAFCAMCNVYEGDPKQVAICARVLAFYFLTEQTRGAVLTGWTEPNLDLPDLVGLHPAIIQAAASIPLERFSSIPSASFLDLVGSIARSTAESDEEDTPPSSSSVEEEA